MPPTDRKHLRLAVPGMSCALSLSVSCCCDVLYFAAVAVAVYWFCCWCSCSCCIYYVATAVLLLLRLRPCWDVPACTIPPLPLKPSAFTVYCNCRRRKHFRVFFFCIRILRIILTLILILFLIFFFLFSVLFFPFPFFLVSSVASLLRRRNQD